MNLVLVEDNADQAATLRQWLEAAGHATAHYLSGTEFQNGFRPVGVDLVILDWELPGISGLSLLKHLRGTLGSKVAVLFVTNRDAEEDIATALDAGADDYMVKPVNRFELLARVSAILRRTKGSGDDKVVLDFPPYRIDETRRQIFVDGAPVELTQKEFEVARFLFRNIDKLLPRAEILESVWGRYANVPTRTLDTHLSRIRSKLNLRPETGYRLVPIYSHGYRLERLEPVGNTKGSA